MVQMHGRFLWVTLLLCVHARIQAHHGLCSIMAHDAESYVRMRNNVGRQLIVWLITYWLYMSGNVQCNSHIGMEIRHYAN